MKKALLALSIATGFIATAQAENSTTLYGGLGLKVVSQKNDWIPSQGGTTKWNLHTHTAEIGVKGTEDLGNGMQAFFNFKFGFNNDGDANNGLHKTDLALIGLTGNWGTLTLGKQDSIYKLAVNYNDRFKDLWWGLNNSYINVVGGGELTKAISYVSPEVAGFQFGVIGVLDGSHQFVKHSDSKSFTAYQASIFYRNSGFFAGLGYAMMDTDINWIIDPTTGQIVGLGSVGMGKTEAMGGSIGYSNDTFRIGLGAEHASSIGDKVNVQGEYYVGPHTFRAGAAVAIKDVMLNPDKNVYNYGLGYHYNFSKRTYTYIEGRYIDWNRDNVDNGFMTQIGLRHDF